MQGTPQSAASSQGASQHDDKPLSDLAPMAVAALGVVYGDLGTSPLYTLKECFKAEHGVPLNTGNVLGILSLIFWSLVLIVSVKYIRFILRADNQGEGGILSLVALLTQRDRGPSRHSTERGFILMMGLFGAALLYGDGVITPTISVYSAIEGLQEVAPQLERLVMPLTAGILIALFLIQHRGTARIGRVFGPIMLIWFACIALCGLPWIVRNPDVLRAVNPYYAVSYFQRNGLHGFLSLGAVVLCVTGCEALYADMGHFGPRAIRAAWYGVVLPASLISYFAQGALLLHTPTLSGNPFYQIVPGAFLYPMVVIATLATIVASQSLISGAFSLTRQAVQLGYFPRTHIIHTSSDTEGQIYVPTVNVALLVGCVWLVFAFRDQKSSGLAAAFGLAVTTTMVLTAILFALVARRQWAWPRWRVFALIGLFLAIDATYLSANLAKLVEGGWIPLSIGAVLFTIMMTWRQGREELHAYLSRVSLPLDLFLADLAGQPLYRHAGTAVFLTGTSGVAPLHLLHHIKHNKALPQRVLLLSVLTERVPVVSEEVRIQCQELSCGFFQVTAHYGYMESPHVPALLEQSGLLQPDAEPPSYFLGRETVLPAHGAGIARWHKRLFTFLHGNARPVTAYFGLPPNRVVELGAQIEL